MNILRRSFRKTIPSLNCIHLGPDWDRPVRTIFTQETLGITAYLNDRETLQGRTAIKLLEMLENENKKQDWFKRYPFDVLADDLRIFVHSVKPDQIDLLKKALEIYRFRSLKNDETKTPYLFGSIVMRFFSHYQMPEVAAQFFFDEQIGPLFEDLASYTILLDMFYDAGKYKELLEVHKISSESRMKPNKLGSTFVSINAIVFAACFQLDTPRHRQYAFDLYERIKNENMTKQQLRKGLIQVAEMKRRDKQPEECLNILSEIEGGDASAHYVKILALLDLNRLDEAFQLLLVLVRIKDFRKVFPVPNELLKLFKSKLIAAKKGITDFEVISNRLRKWERTTDKTLNDAICHPYPKRLVLFRPYRYTKVYNAQHMNNNI